MFYTYCEVLITGDDIVMLSQTILDTFFTENNAIDYLRQSESIFFGRS